MKPVVMMNSDFRPERKDGGALNWINAGYYESILSTGGIPAILPQLPSDDDLRQILRTADGLLMIGCKLDLDPIRMGLDPHPATRTMPTVREDFDRRLAKIAYELKIPTLAIGSGMQTMNVVCGGTLYQHVLEEVPKALHHRDLVETNLRHIIDIVPGTRLDQIYGPGEIRVNSDHHMAVEHLAPCFRVCATTPDSVIEAYESIDENWFCMGVQWHPESETASALDMQVVEAFMDACKESAAPNVLQMPKRKVA